MQLTKVLFRVLLTLQGYSGCYPHNTRELFRVLSILESYSGCSVATVVSVLFLSSLQEADTILIVPLSLGVTSHLKPTALRSTELNCNSAVWDKYYFRIEDKDQFFTSIFFKKTNTNMNFIWFGIC